MNPLIAPSVLAADFANLQKEVEMINGSAADYIHVDIMDGVFVPNISMGLPVVEAINRYANKPLDVHLMIVNPENYLAAFQKAGAAHITVHSEACPHLHRTIQSIKELGCKAGVAVNPHTPIAQLEDIIREVDIVILMSVNPGFGGQKFIENTYKKVHRLAKLIVETGSHAKIEIDGGVSMENARKLFDAGANILVAGNFVFSSENPQETIKKLKNIV
ncbi:ribulose-phosphate 3-epimerase [Cyclobacterium jeungdonense]|uniref:Ribulose-phosphate 3-epimerase n=1 Tax=Cyclobacterium jeungdonense TaxID=708087 RepID=A0ABT8CE05_9BACT|nr:ribulose-phosphate 3-epimerase [Cyclobacterium jeungdonense]MDN3690194.1 ribulose-phosphate 3-epimerase [Cyclobacterium jeungdonense]